MLKEIICILMVAFMLSGCGAMVANWRKQDCKDYVYTHPNLPKPIKNAILDGNLIEGMTKEQVRLVAGDYQDSTYKTGNYERWTYRYSFYDFPPRTVFVSVTFTSGVVTEISEYTIKD